ncbi:MAG: hypothetical protein KF822_09510 [Steroidobacteraceae bacterium]|nr:hypothetical protein [Steroidobacteraceae bacterium]
MSRFVLETEAPAAEPASTGRFVLEQPEEPSLAQRVGRQVGLTARHGVNALASTVGIVSDPIAATINLATGSRIPFARETADSAMTVLGLPVPEGGREQFAAKVTEAMNPAGMVGAGTLLSRAATPAVQAVGNALRAGPGMQAVSGASSAAAGEAAKAAGYGDVGQGIAALGGALAPSAVEATAFEAARRAMRGGEQGRQVLTQRLEDITRAGAQPTTGLGTGRRPAQAAESVLSKVPGGAGPVARAAEGIQSGIGRRVGEIADDVAANADPDAAGRAIERGVKSFVGRFKGEQQFLYNKLDRFIPPDTAIDVSNTRAALQGLTADIQGAPRLSATLRNAKIADIAAAFTDDAAAAGTLPYEAIKKIRTQIGNAISDSPLVADAPKAQLKELYGALTRDMEAAAAAAGPDAQAALARANRFTRAGMDRIENHLERTIGKTAEQTYKTLVSDPGNASKIAVTLKSLPAAERDIVKATVIERMGKATAGRQDAAGEVFSSETFLTNWNRLAPRAKAVLFSGQDGALRRDLDAVARTAEMVREQAKVLANPSGTSGAVANIGAGTAAFLAGLTGNPGTAVSIMAAMGAANLSARTMTNPDFVRWLARTTRLPAAALPSALAALNRMAGENPEIAGDLQAFSQGLRQ